MVFLCSLSVLQAGELERKVKSYSLPAILGYTTIN